MSVPLLDLKAQYASIKDDLLTAIQAVMESQNFILGPTVQRFEKEISDYTGASHSIGVSSGTDALLISLMAAGIGPGDEVITTPYSFFATAGCVARLGGKPVFVDIDPLDFNIDVTLIEGAITKRTKAIIPVHLYGQMVDMGPVMDIARRHDLVVIEDAAQAIGSRRSDRGAGTTGHFGCFSFFPSKNLGGAGDGGLVTCIEDSAAERLTILRSHGGKPKYYHRMIGGNFRLDALQAAVLSVKLRKLDEWTEQRQKNADLYRSRFQDAGIAIDPANLDPSTLDVTGRKGVVLPTAHANSRHIYNQFVLRVDRRDELRAFLNARGVGNEVYYPVPFHKQDCFAYLNLQDGDFPASELAAEQSIAIPIYPELTEPQIKEVVGGIHEFVTGPK